MAALTTSLANGGEDADQTRDCFFEFERAGLSWLEQGYRSQFLPPKVDQFVFVVEGAVWNSLTDQIRSFANWYAVRSEVHLLLDVA